MKRRICNGEPPKQWQQKHVLTCTHSLNSISKIHYLMYCDILKTMPDSRLKIRVYGDRYVSTAGEKIRYVEADRVELAELWKVNI